MIPKIYLATPAYNSQCCIQFTDTVIQLQKLLLSKDWQFQYQFISGETIISFARNLLANDFLNTDSTHLLFLDADMSCNPHDIVRMVEENVDIVGGVYPFKMLHWDWVEHAVKNGITAKDLATHSTNYVFTPLQHTSRFLDSEDLKEVESVGTGYMLIKRHVFETMKPHVKTYISEQYGNYGNQYYSFFNILVKNNISYGEDNLFCQDWRNLGGKIFVAPYAKAKHYGMHSFG